MAFAIFLLRIFLFLIIVGIGYYVVTKIINANKTDLDITEENLDHLNNDIDQMISINRKAKEIEQKCKKL